MSFNTSTVPETIYHADNWTNYWKTFCSNETDIICEDILIFQCPTCRGYAFVLFTLLTVVLASAILLGNVLVIAFVRQSIKKKFSPFYHIKASLAIADILTGIQIFLITIPNVAWTLNSTSKQIYYQTRSLENGIQAYLGGCLFMLSLLCSLYHLVLMSYNRFAAIKWPLETKFQNPKLIYLQLTVVWIISIALSSYPAWFPDYFSFGYVYVLFLYLPQIRIQTLEHKLIAFGCLSIVILAYLLMSIFTISTGCLIRSSARRTRRLSANSLNHSTLKIQKSVYRTLALMEISFTLTLVPASLAYGLSYVGYRNEIALFVSTYLMMCSGVSNVAIYSTRDIEFRHFVKRIFTWKKKRSPMLNDSNQSTATSVVYKISHSTKL